MLRIIVMLGNVPRNLYLLHLIYCISERPTGAWMEKISSSNRIMLSSSNQEESLYL